MAQLASDGASEKDAMLERGSKVKSSRGEIPSQQTGKNSDNMNKHKKTSNNNKKRKSINVDGEQQFRDGVSKLQCKPEKPLHHQGVKMRVSTRFIYHDGLIFSRTICSWICTFFFLICIYIWLALIVVGGIYLLIYTSKKGPFYYGETTFIGGVPGIGFEPREYSAVKKEILLKWDVNDPKTYAFYVKRLQTLMIEYAEKELRHDEFMLNCEQRALSHINGEPSKFYCKTDVRNSDDDYGHGSCALLKKVSNLNFLRDKSYCSTKFGYDVGEPCVMLRINKLFGYYPERSVHNLSSEDLDSKAKKICQGNMTTKCCNDDRMSFRCSLTKNLERTVITEQYPKYGYPYCFYPYNQQNGYMQPFIMIKLINLIPNRKVGIECKPTAKDLQSRSIKLWFQMSRFNQT